MSWETTPVAIQMWSLKTGGFWWQVQLHWNVGLSARNIWSLKTGFTICIIFVRTCRSPYLMKCHVLFMPVILQPMLWRVLQHKFDTLNSSRCFPNMLLQIFIPWTQLCRLSWTSHLIVLFSDSVNFIVTYIYYTFERVYISSQNIVPY